MDVAAERLAVLDRDAADRGDVVDLGLGKIVGALVGGDAVFVEAAGFRPAPRRSSRRAHGAPADARRQARPGRRRPRRSSCRSAAARS